MNDIRRASTCGKWAVYFTHYFAASLHSTTRVFRFSPRRLQRDSTPSFRHGGTRSPSQLKILYLIFSLSTPTEDTLSNNSSTTRGSKATTNQLTLPSTLHLSPPRPWNATSNCAPSTPRRSNRLAP